MKTEPFCANCIEEVGGDELALVRIDGREYKLCADCEKKRGQIAAERASDRRRGFRAFKSGWRFAA